MLFRALILASLLAVIAGCATTTASVTDTTPQTLLLEGDRLFAAKKYDEAITRWKKVKEGDAAPELVTEAEIKIGDAQFADKNYIEAAASYENFRKFHPNHDKTPYALYRLGLCYFNQITGIDTEQTPVKNAVTMFETFLRQYPSSEYGAEVRALLDECRVKQIQYELYVGRFYLRTGRYVAAIKRLEEALILFPKSPLTDEALFTLGTAYLKNGDTAKAQQVLNRILQDFPSSRYAKEARGLLKS